MEQRFQRALSLLTDQPWAIQPSKLETIMSILETRMQGGRMEPAEIQAAMQAAAQPRGPARTGSTAIVPILGVISHRASAFSEMSGGTSTEGVGAQFREAMRDRTVGSVVLDIDSPGGAVSGITELAAEIRDSRGDKPIISAINGHGASAAYWLASAADEIAITPSGMAGSIGVVMSHVDRSAFNERMGLDVTYIHSSPHKVEGNPDAPLDGEAMAAFQAVVDEYHTHFVEAVAAGRGTSAGDVSANYGQGRMLTAERALAAGMVDHVEPFRATLARVVGGAPAAPGRAQARQRLRMLELA